MSLGEARVRTTFNPSASGLVDQIKQKTAELIDLCNEPNKIDRPPMTGETQRLWALAQTTYEEAAMWAVKAATA
jgi:hypothetical protein